MYFYWFDHFAEHNFTEEAFSKGQWADMLELHGGFAIQRGIINQWLYVTDVDGREILDITEIHAQEYVNMYFYAITMAKESHRLLNVPAMEEDVEACLAKWGLKRNGCLQ
tara:strand:- start:273 stop:602 length:330 start_codon:yes stop_codon:yes gene_type:complete